MVPPKPKVEPIPNEKLPEPIVFHDGRLVQKPTPLMALLIILWIPIAFPLPLMPVNCGWVPPPHAPRLLCILGTRRSYHRPSTTHQKVNRPIRCPLHLLPPNAPRPNLPLHCPRAPIPAVTYSVSRLSEIISPIKTMRLTRPC